jgi:hypothetical protein
MGRITAIDDLAHFLYGDLPLIILDFRGQKGENRRQKTDGRRQKVENRGQRAEGRKQKAEGKGY